MVGGEAWTWAQSALEDLCLGALSLAAVPACLFPPLQVCARRALRPRVSLRASQSLPCITKVQAIQLPMVTTLVRASSVTVGVELYVALFCVLTCFGQARFALTLSYVLMLCLLVGNAMKDLVCAPRPASVAPKEVHVKLHGQEREFEKEYGLPSTHVANSACMVLYIVQAATTSAILPPEWTMSLTAVGVSWVAWIAWGRLYLGMHSPVDLVSGLLVGLGVAGGWITIEQRVEAFLLSGFASMGLVLSIFIFLLSVYPRPERYTPSYEQVVTFVGGVFGMNCGVLHSFPGGPPANRYLFRISGPLRAPTVVELVRVVLTLCFAVGTKLATKKVIRSVVEAAFDVVPTDLRQLWQPPVKGELKEGPKGGMLLLREDGEPWDVDITVRFVAYAIVGWVITAGSGAIFALVGL